ncbi:hypothetical protein PYH37_003956 [Sinorhizobium numidicum]|uniref:DUF2946 domain-containing protein n=1 Tax=Sinorhizobium numidicum TaxID=680248 RepID=A0ABY8CUR5_9HYPH|nr:hypothetical protein [Sinorhizobium numidicum]WEX78985.1 hypothetical protein PYH37_003956 [Sinorhizobium numidicum]WEX82381.1 hypothetical protein PYH38_004668 [Sinorhizobium numidicum]
MIAVSQTIRSRARELLVVLVAIMFLFAPMALATSVQCDSPSIEHAETQDNLGHQNDFQPADQVSCCKSVCSVCNAALTGEYLIAFLPHSGDQQHPGPQTSIAGGTSRPLLGPPRTFV